jgi:hypothetical protein
LFTYDHQGRIKDAKSGVEAHGGTETNLLKLPYRQSYTHDAFGNMKSRDSTLWNYTNGDWDFTYNISNNRVAGSQYDNDGRQTYGDDATFVYDASGKMVSTSKTDAYQTTRASDGVGRETKRSNRVWDEEEEEWKDWKTTYLIPSSLLGKIVSEADDTGKKRRTMVIAAGAEIARQSYNGDQDEIVGFIHRDAAGLSGRTTKGGTGAQTGTNAHLAEEFDGMGNNVGIVGDLHRPPYQGGSTQSPFDPFVFDDMSMGDCELDGILTPCSMLRGMGNALAWEIRRWNQRDGFTYEHADIDRSLPGNLSMPMWFSDTQTAVTGIRDPDNPNDRGESYSQTYNSGQWVTFNMANVSWSPQTQGSIPVDREFIESVRPFMELALNRDSCKAFIEKYVGGDDLLAAFDKVLGQGDVVQVPRKERDPYSAFATGSLEKGTAQIQFNFNPSPWPSDNLGIAYTRTKMSVLTFIHELIHLARGDGDFEMAVETYAGGDSRKPPPNREDFDPITGRNSQGHTLGYASSYAWKDSLSVACLPPDREFKIWWQTGGQ